MKKSLPDWTNRYVQPSVGLKTLDKLQRKVLDALLLEGLSGLTWDHHIMMRAVVTLESLCKGVEKDEEIATDCSKVRQALLSLLTDYVGKEVSLQDLQVLARTFAGKFGIICKGGDIRPWNGVTGVWSIIEILSIEKWPAEKATYKCKFEVKAGPATGSKITKYINHGFAKALLKAVAFNKFEHLTEHPLHLGGMWFVAWLEQKNGKLDLLDIGVSAGMKEHNKELIALRKTTPCNGTFKPGKQCILLCPVSRSECMRSTHLYPWGKGMCKNASSIHTGYIAGAGYCTACLAADVIKNPNQQKEN